MQAPVRNYGSHASPSRCPHGCSAHKIARPNEPDSAEIGIEEPDDAVGNDLELDVKRTAQEGIVGAG